MRPEQPLVSLLLLLAVTTVGVLLVRRYAPFIGEPLWRAYRRTLIWLVRAPFRLVRLLVREISGARRRP